MVVVPTNITTLAHEPCCFSVQHFTNSNSARLRRLGSEPVGSGPSNTEYQLPVAHTAARSLTS